MAPNLAETSLGKKKRWSIMVYLAGGADVSDEARESLLRMKLVGSTENIHLIAQFDSGSEGTFTKRYYLSPFTDAIGIESLLRGARDEVPATSEPYDSTAGMNYCRRLRETLSESHKRRMNCLPTKEIIELLKYSPNRFNSFILNCILEEDLYPRSSGNVGDTNAGDPKVLVDFVRWAKVRYPADHYMVILWGHGSGLSVAWDYPSSPFIRPADALTVKELRKAFTREETAFRKEKKAFLEEEEEHFRQNEHAGQVAGIVPQEAVEAVWEPPELPEYRSRVDIVGFNSCSLGTIEVYHQLRDLAGFGIASEGFTPKTSWPYDLILRALDKNPRWTPEKFANNIAKEYIAYYKKSVETAEELQKIERKARCLGANLDMNWGQSKVIPDLGFKKPNVDLGFKKPNVDLGFKKPNVDLGFKKPNVDLGSQESSIGGGIDLSVCKLACTKNVTNRMRDLVDLLLGAGKPHFRASIFPAVLAAHAVSQSYFNRDFTDLYDFCRALRRFCSDESIKRACRAVMTAIRAMCRKPGRFGNDVKNSNGVSIFFPWGEWKEQDVIARYKQLEFIKDTRWDIFLRTYRNLIRDF